MPKPLPEYLRPGYGATIGAEEIILPFDKSDKDKIYLDPVLLPENLKAPGVDKSSDSPISDPISNPTFVNDPKGKENLPDKLEAHSPISSNGQEVSWDEETGKGYSYIKTPLQEQVGLKPRIGQCGLDSVALARKLVQAGYPNVRIVVLGSSNFLAHVNSIWSPEGTSFVYGGYSHEVVMSENTVYDLQSTLGPLPLDEYLSISFPDQRVQTIYYDPDKRRIALKTIMMMRMYNIIDDSDLDEPIRIETSSLGSPSSLVP